MTANEFANSLGIKKEGQFVDGAYVITLKNSNEYARMYSLLDKSDLVDLDSEEVDLGVSNSILVYLSDDFDVVLQANFDEDRYTITIKEATE